jgi:hypothetical protein
VNLAELKALTCSVEPDSADRVSVVPREKARAYNDLIARFHRLVTLAGSRLVMGAAVDDDLVGELRAIARALPELRRRVEARV